MCCSSRKYSATASAASGDPEARGGRRVHLPEHHGGPVQQVGGAERRPKLVPFADPLADPSEHGDALVNADDGAHEFHQHHRFADAGAAEQACLAAAGQGTQEVQHLDAREQGLDHGAVQVQRGWGSVQRRAGRCRRGRQPVQRPTQAIHHAPRARVPRQSPGRAPAHAPGCPAGRPRRPRAPARARGRNRGARGLPALASRRAGSPGTVPRGWRATSACRSERRRRRLPPVRRRPATSRGG